MKSQRSFSVFLSLCFFLFASTLSAQRPFVTTWKTDNPGSSNSTSITIPTLSTGFNYDVDWENDGIYDDFGITGNITHDYGVPGTYTVAIRGDFPWIFFNNGGDNEKILSVEQWGDIAWTSMENAFFGCSNLVVNATDAPNLSNVTSTRAMFAFATSLNQDISTWDVSNVTRMDIMFYGASSFNQNIGTWNVGSVTNMTQMFLQASSFNQDLSSWNVSNVTTMQGLFDGAAAFNQPLNTWDVSSVTNMTGMFANTTAFNQDLSAWNVGNVITMQSMFAAATLFNQDISGWNVANVQNMGGMFLLATSFNQDIGDWNVSNVTDMVNMFDGATAFDQDLGAWDISSVNRMTLMFQNAALSTANYDATLTGWATLDAGETQIPTNITFDGGNSQYSPAGAPSRQLLIDTYGWTITDGGQAITAPQVVSIFPENGAVDVPLNTSITITFDRNVVRGTGASFLSTDTNFFSFILDPDLGSAVIQDNVVTFTPGDAALDLDPNSQTTITIPNNAFEDGSGNFFDGLSWSFSMVSTPDATPPVGALTPLNAAVDVPLDQTFQVGFDEEVAFKSGGIALTDAPGNQLAVIDQANFNLQSDGTNSVLTFQIDPSIFALQPGTSYRLYIPPFSFEDLAGNDYAGTGVTPQNGIDPGINWQFTTASPPPQLPFVTTWQTTTDNENITVPTNPSFTYNYSVDWGDGTSDAGVAGDITHTYAAPGTYTVSISGDFPAIRFNNGGDKDKILTVEQWGDILWSSMDKAFTGCVNLEVLAVDVPDLSTTFSLASMFEGCTQLQGNAAFNNWDLSNVRTLNRMFYNARNFNQNIGNWNVSQVTSAFGMFQLAASFNQDIGAWDVSSVRSMNNMFQSATAFNQDIGGWNVGAVESMNSMFSGASSFNQNIGNWDVSKVRFMSSMFASTGTDAFNQDLSLWDVSSVERMDRMFLNHSSFNGDISTWDVLSLRDMSSMFQNAAVFNQPIGGWNVSGVTNMSSLFSSAVAFDQDIGSWDVGNVNNMFAMFAFAASFNQDIGGWNTAKVTRMDSMFSNATSFNQDISSWPTGAATRMNSMFANAPAFDQDLSAWDISSVSFMESMFQNTGLSTANYDATITGWATLDAGETQVPSNITFDGGNSQFCFSEADRQALIDTFGWTITDAGKNCPVDFTNAFVTTWETTVANEDITLPTVTGLTYDYAVDWGDGTIDTNINGPITHTYSSPGIQTISIVGTFPRLNFRFSADRNKIRTIEQWGAISWSSMEEAFRGCSNLEVMATDAPDLSNVTTLKSMFNGCTSMVGNSSFDSWDTSNITNMEAIFLNASSFNAPIGSWNLSGVTIISSLFLNASSFNQPIGNWNTSSVTQMFGVFNNATAFNQPLETWDTSKVTIFDNMFNGASSFNQPLNNWDVSSASVCSVMFANTTAFDQPLGNWDISSFSSANNFFAGAGLSRANYDATLTGWATLDAGETQIPQNITFSGGNSLYCDSESDRQALIDSFGWTITDGGRDPNCQLPFVTIWKTDNPGTSASNQIIIPTNPSFIYNYSVDWGDGTSDTGLAGDITHTYLNPGTYTVSIRGDFPAIFFNRGGDKQKILSVEQWGDIAWESMNQAFYECVNLDVPATDFPDLSAVLDMSDMFRVCISLVGTPSFNSWDTSNVTDMSGMFADARIFNQNISSWDVSSVTDMQIMFAQAFLFNGAVDDWNVSSVTTMNNMFASASSFNQDLANWDVSNVIDMSGMFREASIFNQDIGYWNVGSVTNMTGMFNSAAAFNQNINDWNVSAVSSFGGMFVNATTFNQNLGSWDISSATNMNSMFLGVTLSTANYDATLTGWATLDAGETQIPSNITFDGGNSLYCDSESDRQALIDTFGWTITDGGRDPNCQDPFVTTWKTDNSGTSADNEITIPTNPSFTYNYSVDWGDGSSNAGVTGGITHTYATAGTYTVSIRGDFPAIQFLNTGDKDKILAVEQWGEIQWLSFERAFDGCVNLDVTAADVPNLTLVENLFRIFNGCSSLIGTSSFRNWNTSSVTNMSVSFRDASSFNQNIGNWDVSRVTTMSEMFTDAVSFNQDISSWDVSSVNSMGLMFERATSFNQDISVWDVSNVQNMVRMFAGASSFNQDLGRWDISSITFMNDMFGRQSSFFPAITLSTENYDSTVLGWATLDAGETQIPSNITFGGGNSLYCFSEFDRQNLIDTFGWTITDGGRDSNCQRPFVTTWQTNNPGTSADNQITIPTNPSFTYNYRVDWGDGSSDTGVTGDITHTYASPGNYRVSISGDFPAIQFANTDDKDKLITVEQWGEITWQSFSQAFHGCSNMDVVAADAPLLSGVTDMFLMFSDCSSLLGSTSFNSWDVSGVTNMVAVFQNAGVFNVDISNWNTGGARNMNFMFSGATSFNQNIGTWIVSNVTGMNKMFQVASSFNQDISSWDVSSVTDMGDMFFRATAFNQDISSWNVANITNMNGMFTEATSFNQDLGPWDISRVNDMAFMFASAGLSTANYDATLTGWATLDAGETQIPSNITFDGGNSQFCFSEFDRQALIDTFGWTVTDGGRDVSCTFDNQAPQIVCPADIAAESPDGQPLLVTLTDPTGTDNETAPENLVFEGTRSDGLALTDAFPIGETTISWTATDETGNTSEPCDQLISVEDTSNGPISGLVLVDATGDIDLLTLMDGLQLDGFVTGGLDLSIRVNTDGTPVGSILLDLTGPVTASTLDKKSPYTLFGEKGNGSDFNGVPFPEGAYIVTATAYDDGNGNGNILGAVSLQFTILPGGEGNLPPVAVIEATPLSGDAPLEVQFSGSNSLSDSGIDSFSWEFGDGNTSDLAEPVHTYTSPGIYTAVLTVRDIEGLMDQTSIEIIVSDPALNVFDGMTLVDATNDTDLLVLTEGIQIDGLTTEGLSLSVRAEVSGAFGGSILMELTGPVSTNQLDKKSPYSLFGEKRNGSDYNGEPFPPGEYTVKATAYENTNGTGAILDVLTVNFTILPASTSLSARLPGGAMALSPNPASESVNLEFEEEAETRSIQIFDLQGRLLKEVVVKGREDFHRVQVYDLPIGTYIIKSTDNLGRISEKMMVIQR